MARIHPVIPLTLALLALAAYLTSAVSDPRFFFHLAAGHAIRIGGTLPLTDPWTAAGAGKSWVADNWSFDILISWVEGVIPVRGFSILALLATAAFTLSLGFLLSALSGGATLGFLVTILVACGCLERTELGPELCAWTFLLLGCGLCIRPLPLRARALGLACTGAVLANLHSSFLLLPLFAAFLLKGRTKERAICVSGILASAFIGPITAGSFFNGFLSRVRKRTSPCAFKILPRIFFFSASPFFCSSGWFLP